MDRAAIDAVQLKFDPATLFWLSVIIGLMMFGVALGMRIADFRRVLAQPKAPLVGLAAQLLLLPALSFLLALAVRPQGSMSLGMILVGSCPGGNFSNIITHLARGNTAISVSMTAISTAAAIITTPANLAFWGKLHPDTAPILRRVRLNGLDVLRSVLLILGLPLAAGMTVRHRLPRLAARIERPFRILATGVLFAFVILALAANWTAFVTYFGQIFTVVSLHNAMALGLGYLTGLLFRLPSRDRRAVTIEVGIQNSGLGLLLIFSFFDGLGGMATVAGMWGIWHLVSGLSLALIWPRVAGAAAS